MRFIIKSSKFPIFYKFLSRPTKKVLHVTAKHNEMSIVSTSANDLISRLDFEHDFKERNLWKESLVPYQTDHVAAKFRILSGQGTEQDQVLFEPIKTLAQEMNEIDLLILSTPLWNLTVPYIVKQYIDIVIQPGKSLVKLFFQTKCQHFNDSFQV